MKLGLVLEGGASRTYFSCGVLDALLEEQIIADMVIGTSAGIANALSYASGQIGRNIQVAKNYMRDHRYMGIRHLLNPKNRSIYNLEFVFETIPQTCVPFDFAAFSQFKGDVVATVTNLNSGLTEYLPVPKNGRQELVLMASCALPLLFPVIEIDGQPYMDGGITTPVPVEEAIRAGCDKTIVILTRERGYQKQPENLMLLAARFYKQYPEFAKALQNRAQTYNDNMRRVFELEAAGKAFIIAPESMADIKRTESDPDKLERLYQDGYHRLKNHLPALKAYLGS
ncbi:MAG: patatin family protein [Clostridiales bacterium]|nr:patatin family protein [Clostridiales bacterium]